MKANILAKAAIKNTQQVIYLNEWICVSLYETEYTND